MGATILDKIKWNCKPPSPPPPPQIKDEAARRAKNRHFPIFDLGGGGSRFSIYFVQDCRWSHMEVPLYLLPSQ